MVIVYFNVQGVVDPRDGHCYFNVQGVVDPRDGHCLLYNTLVCVSLWG